MAVAEKGESVTLAARAVDLWAIDQAFAAQFVAAGEGDHAPVEVHRLLIGRLRRKWLLPIRPREDCRHVSVGLIDDEGFCCLAEGVADCARIEIPLRK